MTDRSVVITFTGKWGKEKVVTVPQSQVNPTITRMWKEEQLTPVHRTYATPAIVKAVEQKKTTEEVTKMIHEKEAARQVERDWEQEPPMVVKEPVTFQEKEEVRVKEILKRDLTPIQKESFEKELGTIQRTMGKEPEVYKLVVTPAAPKPLPPAPKTPAKMFAEGIKEMEAKPTVPVKPTKITPVRETAIVKPVRPELPVEKLARETSEKLWREQVKKEYEELSLPKKVVATASALASPEITEELFGFPESGSFIGKKRRGLKKLTIDVTTRRAMEDAEKTKTQLFLKGAMEFMQSPFGIVLGEATEFAVAGALTAPRISTAISAEKLAVKDIAGRTVTRRTGVGVTKVSSRLDDIIGTKKFFKTKFDVMDSLKTKKGKFDVRRMLDFKITPKGKDVIERVGIGRATGFFTKADDVTDFTGLGFTKTLGKADDLDAYASSFIGRTTKVGKDDFITKQMSVLGKLDDTDFITSKTLARTKFKPMDIEDIVDVTKPTKIKGKLKPFIQVEDVKPIIEREVKGIVKLKTPKVSPMTGAITKVTPLTIPQDIKAMQKKGWKDFDYVETSDATVDFYGSVSEAKGKPSVVGFADIPKRITIQKGIPKDLYESTVEHETLHMIYPQKTEPQIRELELSHILKVQPSYLTPDVYISPRVSDIGGVIKGVPVSPGIWKKYPKTIMPEPEVVRKMKPVVSLSGLVRKPKVITPLLSKITRPKQRKIIKPIVTSIPLTLSSNATQYQKQIEQMAMPQVQMQIPTQDQMQRLTPIISTARIQRVGTVPGLISTARIQRVGTVPGLRFDTRLGTRLGLDMQFPPPPPIFKLPPIPIPKPKPGFKLPPIPKPKPKRQPRNILPKGFEVEVRKAGKWIKVSKQPLFKGQAKRLGAMITEKTPRASFRLTPSKFRAVPTKIPFTFKPQRFRRPVRKSKVGLGEIWIEKTKFRIDAPSELMGITFKGLRTPRKKPKKVKRKVKKKRRRR